MSYQSLVLLLAVLAVGGAFGKYERIVGGENATIRSYPFVASFKYLNEDLIFCSGAIVSSRHILTAAHCLMYRGNNYQHIRVHTGKTRLRATTGEIHRIARVFVHSSFTGEITERGVHVDDVAVVKVQRRITLNDKQNIIEFAEENVNEGDIGLVLGWGTTSYPRIVYPFKLQKAQMRIYSASACARRLSFHMQPNTQFCAFFQQGIHTCIGDGGAPFIIDKKLVGFLSYNHQCTAGIPNIYTNIFPYLRYIQEVISSF